MSASFERAGSAALADPRREAAAALGASIVARPVHLARLNVTGADARRFLQAQLTADLDLLDPGHRICAAWCTPQGRVRVVMLLRMIDGGFEIEAPAIQTADLAAGLGRFVLRADVRLEPAATVSLGLSGAASATLLADALGHPPPEDVGALVAGGAGLVCARLPGACRFEILGGETELARIWDGRGADVVAAGTDAWRLTDIVAGFPWLGPATAEHHLPQALGLESLGALSFTKGCYPGQEIVARTQYRGRIKRHLRVMTAACALPPEPGSAVVDGDGDARAGDVVDAALDGDGDRVFVAAVVADDAERPCLDAPGRPALEPFEVDVSGAG